VPKAADLPAELAAGPFSRRRALALGVTDSQLRGRRFRPLFRGVYMVREQALSFLVWVRAALVAAPADAVVSHHTAMAVWGLGLPGRHAIHVSTNQPLRRRVPGIVCHRRKHQIGSREIHGIKVTGPERTIVDLATRLPWHWYVVVAEWFVGRQLTTVVRLEEYLREHHLDGVQRGRRLLHWVRERVESPMETLVRLMILTARLPEPSCNVEIVDGEGRFVARVDLAYPAWRVAIEYDGRWHERTDAQRRRDRDRREALERLGWTMIVVYDRDLDHPQTIPRRVFSALRDQGYVGQPPVMSMMWDGWFAQGRLWSVSSHTGPLPWDESDHFSARRASGVRGG